MGEEAAVPDDADSLKRDAAYHFGEGRIDQARRRYSEALRLSPRDLDAREGLVRCLVALGEAALSLGKTDQAIAHYQLALELSPFHPAADAGLRRAAAGEEKRVSGDAFGAALEALPPVKALRNLQVADRVVGKVVGTKPPSELLRGSLEDRRAGLAAGGAPPRERRIEHELAAAWRRRWIHRLLPIAIAAAAVGLWAVVGAVEVLNWGLLLGGFAAVWDYVFVERGALAAKRLEAREPSP